MSLGAASAAYQPSDEPNVADIMAGLTLESWQPDAPGSSTVLFDLTRLSISVDGVTRVADVQSAGPEDWVSSPDILRDRRGRPAHLVRPRKALRFDWEGALEDRRDRYTSAELQHHILDVRGATRPVESVGLPAGVGVPDAVAVRVYLAADEKLIWAAQHIAAALRDGMRRGTDLSLEVYRDPEFDDEQLTFFIRAEHYPPSFMDELRALRARCAPLQANVSDWIEITTDFQPPGSVYGL